MYVNVTGLPAQLFAVGVTVIVPEIALLEVFVPVNEGILPVPLAANPMLVLLFVQA